MKDEEEIQTAWEILNLIEKLDQLLWDRYEDDFIEIDLQEQEDPCLGPLGPLVLTDAQDKKEG
jgi:hypothetical protein